MSTRISTSQLFQSGQDRIASAREKDTRSSEQASSQKQILRPSEDPGGWVRAANLKNDLSLQESISKNASSANHVLTATETLLADVQNSAQRAHELAISASSTSGGGEMARRAVLSEVESLYENVLRTLNTRYGGRTLLAGFKSEGPAFNRDGEFVGDKHSFELEINRDLKVPLNVSTEQTIQGEGMRDGVNIPQVFQTLISGLKNDNVDAVRSTLDGLMKTIDQVSIARTRIGARMSEINQNLESQADEKIQTTQEISQIEEVDPVKAFSNLTRDQTVLRAAISTTEKVIKENPADILFR